MGGGGAHFELERGVSGGRPPAAAAAAGAAPRHGGRGAGRGRAGGAAAEQRPLRGLHEPHPGAGELQAGKRGLRGSGAGCAEPEAAPGTRSARLGLPVLRTRLSRKRGLARSCP